MAKNFSHLREKMSPERQRRNRAEAERMLLEMTLQELRQNVANFSQEQIAEILQVTQGYVSKLERQDDMLLSRLYAYVEALGGQPDRPRNQLRSHFGSYVKFPARSRSVKSAERFE